MKWSFSQHGAFHRCQRQWFYRYVYASAVANDERRRDAHRLSKLVNMKAWRGKVVDDVISKAVIPSVGQRKELDLRRARQMAWNIFCSQKQMGLDGWVRNTGDFRGFLEVEQGSPPTQKAFDQAWSEIDCALHSFYRNDYILNTLREASTHRTQRRIPFCCNGTNLIAVPDVICFYSDRNPFIIDWKVQSNPIGNYWMQLATYALALVTCKPHKDWPSLPQALQASDIKLAEVQLLTGTVREHTLSDDDIEELQEIITCSATEMSLARRGLSPKDLHASAVSKKLV